MFDNEAFYCQWSGWVKKNQCLNPTISSLCSLLCEHVCVIEKCVQFVGWKWLSFGMHVDGCYLYSEMI